MNIVAISNICFEPYWKTYVHDHNCDAQLKFIPYDECLSYTDDIINAGIITVCLNFDVLYPNASIDLLLDQIGNEVMVEDCIVRCNELYSYIRANTNAHLVWFGFEDYYNQKNFINSLHINFETQTLSLDTYLNVFIIHIANLSNSANHEIV